MGAMVAMGVLMGTILEMERTAVNTMTNCDDASLSIL
jgi:hypothetical protein